MRGYRRRGTASYLVGVAVSFLLVIQLGGTLLQLPDKPHWGLVIQGTDQVVRRVMPDSPAARAGIRVGDEVQSFAGVAWARSWDRTYESDGSAVARVRTPGGIPREVRIERAVSPPHEIVRRLVQGLVGLAFVLIGLVVFLSRSDRVSTLFFLMCLLLSRMVLPDPEHSGRGTFLFDKATLDLATLFLAPVVLHFFLNFPIRTRIASRHPRAVTLLYLPSVVAAAVVLKFDVDLITGPDRMPPSAIALQLVTAIVSVVMIVTGVGLFLRGVRKASSPVLRRSLRWVLPGTALGILPPLVMTVILNGNPTLTIPGDRYIFVTFLLVPLTFAHAILRYGLLDLELVV
ncbi:MAG TPA: PDZ domain-containing protein, partial [bacterium]|nr:PDZ domain-containing protein [bacterium]